MSWKRGPTNPKYRTPEHKAERKRLEREMQVRGYLWCAQDVCVMPSRAIKPHERWHVAHDHTGTTYLGAAHAKCNVRDGAVRARARQLGTDTPRGWVL